jgi:hypothetical protein
MTHPSGNAVSYGGVWGLSAREVFAAMAMQGLLLSWVGEKAYPAPERVARMACEYADALITALNDTPQEPRT